MMVASLVTQPQLYPCMVHQYVRIPRNRQPRSKISEISRYRALKEMNILFRRFVSYLCEGSSKKSFVDPGL